MRDSNAESVIGELSAGMAMFLYRVASTSISSLDRVRLFSSFFYGFDHSYRITL